MALFSTKLEVLTLVWVNESKAVNYIDISKAAFWSSQSFIDDFYQSNTLKYRIKHTRVQYLEDMFGFNIQVSNNVVWYPLHSKCIFIVMKGG